MSRTRTAHVMLACFALSLVCLCASRVLAGSTTVTAGATIHTRSPNGVHGQLYLPAGLTINDQKTEVNAVITRGTTSAGAVLTLHPTDPATGVTAFSGVLVGVDGVPDSGDVGFVGSVTIFLP